MTDRYAVVGNPVSHSLSPRIHALFASATGQDMRYAQIEAPLEGFAAAAQQFFADGGKGLNVTLPFKVDAWHWVNNHDEAAAQSGAVNTIVADGNRRRGCNTDGIGLVNDLTINLGWPLRGARTLLLGAGGAARGVLAPLQRAGVDNLTIANRSLAKARHLADRLGAEASALDAVGGGWDVVINGTSAGMGGMGMDNVRQWIAPATVADSRCYDMFYALDGATPFCRWAAAAGAQTTSDGLGMLVEQAAAAFVLWRGVRPDTAGIAATLRRVAS